MPTTEPEVKYAQESVCMCECGGERAPTAWVEQNKSRYYKTESGNKRANRNDSSTNCGNINWNAIDEWLKLIMKYTNELPTTTPCQLSNSIIIRIEYAKLVLLDVYEPSVCVCCVFVKVRVFFCFRLGSKSVQKNVTRIFWISM